MSELGGVWRTIRGRRVFIKDGEDLSSAMKRSGKFKTKMNEMAVKGAKEEDLKEQYMTSLNNVSEMEYNGEITKDEYDQSIKNINDEYKSRRKDINGRETRAREIDKLNNSGEDKTIHTQSGSYSENELKDRDESIKQMYKDTWSGNKSYKDLHTELESMKSQGKISQGELDALKYDASGELDNWENNPKNAHRGEYIGNNTVKMQENRRPYEHLKEHILSHYTKDYGYDAESPEKALIDQVDYMRYGGRTNTQIGEEIAEGGGYLIYNEDMGKFLKEAGIDYKEGEEFDTYKKVIGRATDQIISEYNEEQSNKQSAKVKKLASEIKETQRQHSNEKISQMSLTQLRSLANEYDIDTKGKSKKQLLSALISMFNK